MRNKLLLAILIVSLITSWTIPAFAESKTVQELANEAQQYTSGMTEEEERKFIEDYITSHYDTHANMTDEELKAYNQQQSNEKIDVSKVNSLDEIEKEMISKLAKYDIQWLNGYYENGNVTYLGENRFVYFDSQDNSILLNEQGKVIKNLGRIKPEQRIVKEQGFSEGLCTFQDYNTGLYGAMNTQGEFVIPAQYKGLGRLKNGVALALNKDYRYGYINKKGDIVIPFEYQYLGEYGDLILADRGSDLITQYGWINKNNKTVIPFDYIYAWDFSDGLARVQKVEPNGPNGPTTYNGYIDKSGRVVIPFKYTISGDFSEGLAWASTEAETNAAGVNGKNIEYINTKGEIAIPYKFEQASDFHDGRAIICNSNDYSTYGIIDKSGKIIKEISYDGINITGYEDELSLYSYDYWYDSVAHQIMFGFFDRDGNDMFKDKGRYLDKLNNFNEGLARFEEVDDITRMSSSLTTGFMDKSFKTIISVKEGDNIGFGGYFIDGRVEITLKITNGKETRYKVGMLKNPLKEILATPANSKILVDGKQVDLEVYNIDGSNYFKLRDLAKLVNGTSKQFEVSWNAKEGAIELISNNPYTSTGQEMKTSNGVAKVGKLNLSKTYKDSQEVNFKAYTINENNYFKLRDIAEAFDIGILWDAVTSTINIDTSISYTTQ